MKRFLEIPNIPQGRVCLVICDGRISNEIEDSLKRLNIDIIKTHKENCLDESVSYHPDMQICHLGSSAFVVTENAAKFIFNKTPKDSVKKIDIFYSYLGDKKISYPKDIQLNAAILGEYVLCNEEYTNKNIIGHGKKIINVKQGYAKCSTCIITQKAIITEDVSICKAAEKLGIDVLLIDYGGVSLNGYSYGFIGGASGLIDKNKIAFCGNIELHEQFSKIKAFLKKHNVEYVSLSDKPLYDYGSIIPILEEV